MVAGTSKSMAWIAFLGVMIPICIGLYFMADMFLPMYTWLKVDLKAISASTGIAESQLAIKFKMKVRYNPRGGSANDPMPWQILEMDPPWASLHPKQPDEDETGVFVRCTFVSGNDGRAPSTTFINNTYKDRYWTCEGIRLPPGSLGFNAKRPVVIFDQMSKSIMSITEADTTRQSVADYQNDDEWEDRADSFKTPTAK